MSAQSGNVAAVHGVFFRRATLSLQNKFNTLPSNLRTTEPTPPVLGAAAWEAGRPGSPTAGVCRSDGGNAQAGRGAMRGPRTGRWRGCVAAIGRPSTAVRSRSGPCGNRSPVTGGAEATDDRQTNERGSVPIKLYL